MKSAVKTKAARTTRPRSDRASSRFKNNMEVEAIMELSLHLDETGSPTVCMLRFNALFASSLQSMFSCIQTLCLDQLGLDFGPNFMLDLDYMHKVCHWFP